MSFGCNAEGRSFFGAEAGRNKSRSFKRRNSALPAYTPGTFHLCAWKIGPTELRILPAVGSLELYRGSAVAIFGKRYPLFDVGGMVAIAGIVVTLIITVIHHTRMVYAAEPIRRELRKK